MYVWIRTKELTPFEPRKIDTSQYRLSSSSPSPSQPIQITFPPALLTKVPTPAWLAQLDVYLDESNNLTFEYPNIFHVTGYASEFGSTGWTLSYSNGYPLIQISLTNWSIAQFKKRFPRLEFKPYSTSHFSGYQASYLSDKEDTRFFYLETEPDEAIWIIGRLDQFTQFPNLRYQEKENIIKRIIQSIKNTNS